MFEVVKSLPKILSGLKNRLFPTQYVEKIAKKRSAICQSNVCGFYDPLGQSENVYIKGKPACGLCGCSEALKTRCLSCECPADVPFWGKEMTEGKETKFKKKHNIVDSE